MPLICPTTKAEYFCAKGWMTQITLNRLKKSAFSAQLLLAGFGSPRGLRLSRVVQQIGSQHLTASQM
jgi:hypothetical protein